ncbi:hypothetical protein [Fodinibius halophilus]|uniref:Uncharacterized protein n=1 Tax=Fodinibius halophilus TaxID=1736908 RepID=A0A6M1SUC4_9BACT|nr:hypothetical protein [Fodinibius halophilus]NGP87558.1 hypothetical protein [Fodinibius halophilus]
MDLLNYSSLFELYIVFSFAYIGSETFSSIVNKKIFRSSEKLELKLQKINASLNACENLLTRFTVNKEKVDGKAQFQSKYFKITQEKFDTYKKLNKNFSEDKKEKKSKIGLWRDEKGFAHISLFSALYCFFILYIAGSLDGFEHKSVFITTLFVLSFIHIGLSAIFAAKDLFKKPSDIKFTNWHVIIIWGIMLLLIFIYYNIPHEFHIKYYLNTPAFWWLNIIAILTPLSHYFFYFIRFFRVHHLAKLEIEELRDNYESDIEELSENLRINVNDVDQIINDMES